MFDISAFAAVQEASKFLDVDLTAQGKWSARIGTPVCLRGTELANAYSAVQAKYPDGEFDNEFLRTAQSITRDLANGGGRGGWCRGEYAAPQAARLINRAPMRFDKAIVSALAINSLAGDVEPGWLPVSFHTITACVFVINNFSGHLDSLRKTYGKPEIDLVLANSAKQPVTLIEEMFEKDFAGHSQNNRQRVLVSYRTARAIYKKMCEYPECHGLTVLPRDQAVELVPVGRGRTPSAAHEIIVETGRIATGGPYTWRIENRLYLFEAVSLQSRAQQKVELPAGEWLVAEPTPLRPFYGVCVKDKDPENGEEREIRYDIAPSSFEAAITAGNICVSDS